MISLKFLSQKQLPKGVSRTSLNPPVFNASILSHKTNRLICTEKSELRWQTRTDPANPNFKSVELVPPVGEEHSFPALGCRVSVTYLREAKLLRLTLLRRETLVHVVSENRRANFLPPAINPLLEMSHRDVWRKIHDGEDVTLSHAPSPSRSRRRSEKGKPDLTHPLALKAVSFLPRHR